MKAYAAANRTSPTAVTAVKNLNQPCICDVDGFMLQVALVRGGFHASLRKLAFSVLKRSWPTQRCLGGLADHERRHGGEHEITATA